MSAARQGELTIVGKAKDLVNHTLTVTNNAKLFPKKVRFTICQRMQNISLQILHDKIGRASCRERVSHQV